MSDQILDYFLHFLHLFVIAVNTFGWFFRRFLKIHLIFILSTAFCWFFIGIWYGIGYCPLTDWQWQVKSRLGETNLPYSYITYLLEKLGFTITKVYLVDYFTAAVFSLSLLASLYLNIKYRVKSPENRL